MRREFRKTLLSAVLACAFPWARPASPAEPSYSYVEGAFVKSEHGSKGFGVRGSGALGERLFVGGHLDAYDYWDGSVLHLSIGPGMRWPTGPGLSISADASADILGGAYDEGGMDDRGMSGLALGASVGIELRAQVSDRVEFQGGLRYQAITSESASGRVGGSIGLRIRVAPRLATGFELVHDYFGTRVGVTLRLGLGRGYAY